MSPETCDRLMYFGMGAWFVCATDAFVALLIRRWRK